MSNTKQCPHCRTETDQQATVCPQCRRDIRPSKTGKVLGFLVLLAVLFVGWSWLSAAVDQRRNEIYQGLRPAATARPLMVNVVYEVTGSGASADLTYENQTGNTEQRTVPVPWKQTLTVPAGSFLYVSAQSADDGTRTIGCTISVNGRVLETAESRGRFVIATCSGSAP